MSVVGSLCIAKGLWRSSKPYLHHKPGNESCQATECAANNQHTPCR
jgi:hypothetical protein